MIQTASEKVADLNCVVITGKPDVTPKAIVVICHGFGASATDLVPLAQEMIQRDPALADAAFVFPGAPIELDPAFDARAWWMIDVEELQRAQMTGEFRKLRDNSPELLPERRQQMTAVIDHFRKQYDLPASQVCIGGFSQGSMLTTDVALHYPELLGGLIVWSGTLLNETVWTQAAQRPEKLNVIVTHGNEDTILPLEGAEALRDMLTAAGHSVKYAEFRGPHTIPAEGLTMAVEMVAQVAARG